MNPCVPPSAIAALFFAASRGGHPAPVWVPLLILPVFVIVGALGIRAAIRQQRQARVRLAALAERFHLQLQAAPAGRLGVQPPPVVAGAYRNRAVRFFTYTTGAGKSRTTWCAVAAAAAGAGGLTLDLFPQNFLTHLGVALGMQDIQVGDPAFDPLFVVKSNDPAYAAAALLPEIRARLVEERGRGALGHLTVRNGEVRYAEIGGFAQEARVARLAEMLDPVCDLAEVADVYQKT
jgi:hypothetical protein